MMRIIGRGTRIGAQKMFKMLRAISGSETGCYDSSSSAKSEGEQRLPASYNPEGYDIAEQRTYEFETQKAMITIDLRHERWKAGGPV